MIVLVNEWCNGDFCNNFFDLSKFDMNVPFEVAFHSIIMKAVSSKRKEISNPHRADNRFEKRFGEYQDGTEKLKKLMANLPCQVDDAVTIWIED